MCKNANTADSLLTPEVNAEFQKIEEEFFKKPLCANVRKMILKRYGTVEKYREYIIGRREEMNLAQKEKRSPRATFKVALITPEGNFVIDGHDESSILIDAMLAGIDLPYSCFAGACSSCVGKVTAGTVDQSWQTYLDDEQLAAGFVVLCVGWPTSDCVIWTHMEEELVR